MSSSDEKFPGKSIFMGIVYLLGVIIAFYALNTYIDKRIEKKLSEKGFIEKVASRVVIPFVIFDENEHVISVSRPRVYEEFVKKIVVRKNKKNKVQEIIFSPKIFLEAAPILESLDSPIQFHDAVKDGSLDWKYTTKKLMSAYLVAPVEGQTDQESKRFKITIIR